MARPIKNNAEYFSHDRDMRNDPKIKYIRSKYGNEGYAVYCMLLEYITGSDDFEVAYDHMGKILLAGDLCISLELLDAMMQDFILVKLFSVEEEKLTSHGLKKRLNQVTEKREKMQELAMRRWKKDEKSDAIACENDAIACENDAKTMRTHCVGRVSAEKTMQSKVKESTVKESNTETDTSIFPKNADANASEVSETPKTAETPKPQDKSVSFDEFWALYPKKVDKKKASALWKTLSKTKQKSAFSAIPEHACLWECEDREQSIIPHPTTWLRNERWNDVIVFPEKKPSTETELAEKRRQRELEEKNREDQKRLDEEKFTRTLYDFFSKLSESKREEIKKIVHESTLKILGSTDRIGFEQMYRGRLRNHIAELYNSQLAKASE